MPRCASDACRRPSRWWHSARQAGASLDQAWVCSRACVERLALTRLAGPRPAATGGPALPAVRLGALLRQQGACTAHQIDDALAAQSETHLRLGEQLRAMGAVADATLLRALAAQAGVGYLASIDGVHAGDAPRLPIDTILALGVVPIGPPGGERIRVAVTAPVPRTALTAFRHQTGWTPVPFLVSDDNWRRLIAAYRAAGDEHAHGQPTSLPTRAAHPADAAARTADAVMEARVATMREARWGSYVWVRVQGESLVRDVLFEPAAAAAPRKEGTWQAASTSR